MKRLQIILIFFLTITASYSQDTVRSNFAIAPIKNNFLYLGIENPLSISVSDFSSKDLIIKTSNGMLTGENGTYKIKPISGHTLEISIFIVRKSDTCFVGAEHFRLKQLPDPDIFPAWCKGQSSVNKFELINGGGIIANIEDFAYNIKFPIKSFELKIIKNNTEIILKSNKNAYTKEMTEQIRQCETGAKIIFQNFIVIYPDNTEKLFDKNIILNIL